MKAPPPLKIKTFTEIRIFFDCIQDADDLISDIKEAKRKAKRSGGAHYVYRTDPKTGNKFLIELRFPFNECL